MSCPKNKLATALKAKLIERMGGKCAWPGCGSTDRLEFDHPNGRAWQPREMSRYSRLVRYRREWEADPTSVRLLCFQHNKKEHPPGCKCVVCVNYAPEPDQC